MTNRELPSGVYEIYYTTNTEVQPFGLDSPNGQSPQLVQLPVGATPARFTITKVGTKQFTIQTSGAYLAKDSIWVKPSSTPFTWTILDDSPSQLIGGDDYYTVWLPDTSAGWWYLVLGFARRGLDKRVPPGELEIYLADGSAKGWWFKKVA